MSRIKHPNSAIIDSCYDLDGTDKSRQCKIAVNYALRWILSGNVPGRNNLKFFLSFLLLSVPSIYVQ